LDAAALLKDRTSAFDKNSHLSAVLSGRFDGIKGLAGAANGTTGSSNSEDVQVLRCLSAG
jgi:hypothetical protein